MKIYVASSWRNKYQPDVVKALEKLNHQVYDFKNPQPYNDGFKWSEIDPNWEGWNTEKYVELLDHPTAKKGFFLDYTAMKWADMCVLVLPCGRSAHLEAGWFAGQGKTLLVFIPEKQEPDLMYKMADKIVSNIEDLKLAIPIL
jgi:hypothetical protein